MDHRDWMKIGHNPEQQPLRQAVVELKSKWPDRFDFRIVASPQENVAEKGYLLYLRHRPD